MAGQLPDRARPHVSRGPSRARPPRARLAAHDRGPVTPRTPLILWITRYGLPALTVLAGIAAMAVGTDVSLIGGAALIGAGLATWLIAWLYRVGVDGDRARDAEERARRHFERTGRWPEA